jgi:hypothetical protein
MMSNKSWAERHPVLFGALVGSVVPGIGTIAGALGGVVYDLTERADAANDREKEKSEAKVET